MDFPSLVINLDIRPERLAQFMSQAAVQALSVERLPAVYWKDIDIPESWLTLNRGPGGGYATTISHRNAIMTAKMRGYTRLLVFEDDAIVPSWFPDELRRFHEHLPFNWDLVFFGGAHTKTPWPHCFPEHVSGPVYRGYQSELLDCYMVNAKAYDHLLNLWNRQICIPTGWPTLHVAQDVLNYFVPLNLPVRQPSGWSYSDNWNENICLDWLEDRSLIEGSFADEEGIQYLTECMKVPGETVVELGSWMGRATSWVAEWVGSHGGMLCCVDLWGSQARSDDRTRSDFEWYMWRTDLRERLRVIESDTLAAARLFEDDSVGLVMFDSHAHPCRLSQELDTWIPKVRRGGVLCGHDYRNESWPGVKEAVHAALGHPDRLTGGFWATDKRGRERNRKAGSADV